MLQALSLLLSLLRSLPLGRPVAFPNHLHLSATLNRHLTDYRHDPKDMH
jgi:hypothetical protein